MTDATKEEVFTLDGAPEMQAVSSNQDEILTYSHIDRLSPSEGIAARQSGTTIHPLCD
jgi:hypothetical protein